MIAPRQLFKGKFLYHFSILLLNYNYFFGQETSSEVSASAEGGQFNLI